MDIVTREAVVQHLEKLQCVPQTKSLARVCKATTKEVYIVSNASTRDEHPFFIGTIGSKQVGDKDWYVNFHINNCTIPFKIDTGAQCNVMLRSTCDEAGIVTSGSSRSKLVSQARNQGGFKGCVRTPPPQAPKVRIFDTRYPSYGV